LPSDVAEDYLGRWLLRACEEFEIVASPIFLKCGDESREMPFALQRNWILQTLLSLFRRVQSELNPPSNGSRALILEIANAYAGLVGKPWDIQLLVPARGK
jgi:hypothetical protein